MTRSIAIRSSPVAAGTRKFSATKGIVRGMLAVLAVVFWPFIAGPALIRLGAELGSSQFVNWVFGLGLTSIWVFVPHFAVSPDIPQQTAFALAVAQWALVGVVLGRVTTSMSNTRVGLLALAAAVAISAITHATLRALGYVVIVEGP